MTLTALIVDDEDDFRISLEMLVKREDFECRTAASLGEALAELQKGVPDVVLIDLHLPDGNGLEFLREQGVLDTSEVIVVTGQASVESAVDALHQGAADYLSKPIDRARLISCLKSVGRTRALKQQVSILSSELRDLGHFNGIIGRSSAMQQVFDLIQRVAPTDASVFITGESGVGKELVAQTIHKLSKRSAGPLLPVNCGAMPANLIESELFGHERGSFTGAERRREGCFERASGGTLFLDEITELPPELQVKLLRVLESRTFTRVGGNESIATNVRVLAATNRDLRKAVEDKVLREDLFYRLNVFPIVVPPLADRGHDVVLLAENFLDQFNDEHGTAKNWTPAALAQLARQPWRGNVRELKNVVQRAFILAESELGTETLEHVSEAARDSSRVATFEVSAGSNIGDVERRLIEATLTLFNGDKAKTADALGISIKTLYNRINVYSASRPAT